MGLISEVSDRQDNEPETYVLIKVKLILIIYIIRFVVFVEDILHFLCEMTAAIMIMSFQEPKERTQRHPV